MCVLVFDVIETLLDLGGLDPVFEELFGERSVRQQWFEQMLQSGLVSTVTDTYRDFTQLGRAALRMTAERPRVLLLAEQRLGVEPTSVRVIAAHAWDVTGAIRAGWAAAFVARPNALATA